MRYCVGMPKVRTATTVAIADELCTATLEWSLETSPPALGGYLTKHGVAHLLSQGRRLDAEKRMLDLPFMAFFARSYETVIEPLMAWRLVGVDRARQQFVDAAAALPVAHDASLEHTELVTFGLRADRLKTTTRNM